MDYIWSIFSKFSPSSKLLMSWWQEGEDLSTKRGRILVTRGGGSQWCDIPVTWAVDLGSQLKSYYKMDIEHTSAAQLKIKFGMTYIEK